MARKAHTDARSACLQPTRTTRASHQRYNRRTQPNLAAELEALGWEIEGNLGDESPDPRVERAKRILCNYGKCGKEAQPGLEFDLDLNDGKPPIQIHACSQPHRYELMHMFLGPEAVRNEPQWYANSLAMSKREMLELQRKADNREQPDALFLDQRIINWSMWKAFDAQSGGIWHALIALEDGTRLELVEDR
jgi:hypothetical protein